MFISVLHVIWTFNQYQSRCTYCGLITLVRSLTSFKMDQSQSLNALPYFDGSNYAFWKVRMRTFLCSIDGTVQDVVDVGLTRSEAIKSTQDKAALVATNENSKALNAIFCGVSLDEFHRISHVTIAKEAWQILETMYDGMAKVKDTKLQMLTT